MLPKPNQQLVDLARPNPAMPAWLRSEMERPKSGTEWDVVVMAGLRLRHVPERERPSLRDLLEGRPPPLDPLRLWLVQLQPRELHAIDDVGRRHAEVLASKLHDFREHCDLDSAATRNRFRRLGRQRDGLEVVRVLLGWRQGLADREPTPLAASTPKDDAELAPDHGMGADLLDGLVVFREFSPRSDHRRDGPPPFEALQLKGLQERLRILDAAMLDWMESLHRFPRIDDPWLQAVAELDPLAWWGQWSTAQRPRTDANPKPVE